MDMSKSELDKVLNQYTQDPITTKIERVAAYVRVSTQEQKLHGLSLDAQRMKLAEYAEKNHMRIVEWYVDEGVSGRKLIRKRPELQRMIHDAEKGEFERIIFIKLDRFFRSVAEYHECMKQISPVVWSTTEEEYDLTTANGRMLVNMKLTIAEMEADQTGERISIVNEYKLSTGQPLTGSIPFCYRIVVDQQAGRKKIVKDPDTLEIMEDILEHFQMHQSIHKTVLYINSKYKVEISYKSVNEVLKNTMLYGEYRGNPHYISDPYIDKDTFDRMQSMIVRNTKLNSSGRDYIFGGLLRCPNCDRVMRGTIVTNSARNGKKYRYKRYRCPRWAMNRSCDNHKTAGESTVEKIMLEKVELILEAKKAKSSQTRDSEEVKVTLNDIENINAQIDRLNYSWQTGKIKTVEKYEKDFAALEKKLEVAKAELSNVVIKDFSKIDRVLCTGWKDMYAKLDEAHRRSFWRSCVDAIYVDWSTGELDIVDINFF